MVILCSHRLPTASISCLVDTLLHFALRTCNVQPELVVEDEPPTKQDLVLRPSGRILAQFLSFVAYFGANFGVTTCHFLFLLLHPLLLWCI